MDRDTEDVYIDGANELQSGATSATRSGSDIIFREPLILDALLALMMMAFGTLTIESMKREE